MAQGYWHKANWIQLADDAWFPCGLDIPSRLPGKTSTMMPAQKEQASEKREPGPLPLASSQPKMQPSGCPTPTATALHFSADEGPTGAGETSYGLSSGILSSTGRGKCISALGPFPQANFNLWESQVKMFQSRQGS